MFSHSASTVAAKVGGLFCCSLSSLADGRGARAALMLDRELGVDVPWCYTRLDRTRFRMLRPDHPVLADHRHRRYQLSPHVPRPANAHRESTGCQGDGKWARLIANQRRSGQHILLWLMVRMYTENSGFSGVLRAAPLNKHAPHISTTYSKSYLGSTVISSGPSAHINIPVLRFALRRSTLTVLSRMSKFYQVEAFISYLH